MLMEFLVIPDQSDRAIENVCIDGLKEVLICSHLNMKGFVYQPLCDGLNQ